MAFDRLMKVGLGIYGRLDASLNKALRAAQSQVSTFGQTLRRDMNSALAGPQHEMQRFFGSALHSQLTGSAIAIQAGMVAGVATYRNYAAQMFEGGLIADATDKEMDEVHRIIGDASRWDKTNQSISQLGSAWKVMLTEGFSLEQANSSIEQVGKIATALGASADDVALTSFQLVNSLGVKTEDLEATFGNLLKTAKMGAFEMKDMARYMPQIATIGQSLGLEGIQGATSLAAMLQTTRMGYANSGEAAGALGGLIQQMVSPRVLKTMKKQFGVDLARIIRSSQARGENPVEAAIEAIKGVAGDDLIKLTQILGRKEAGKAFLTLSQNWETYKNIRDEAMASEGLIDIDFMKRIDSFPGVLQAWRVQLERFGAEIGKALFPVLKALLVVVTPLMDQFLRFAQANPWIVTAGLALGILFSGFILLGPQIMATIQLLAILGKVVASIKIGATIAGWLPAISSLAPALAKLRLAMVAFKTGGILAGVKGLGAAFLALIGGPIGLTILAIIGVGVALAVLYKKNERFRNAVNAGWASISKWAMKAWRIYSTLALKWWNVLSKVLGFAWKSVQGLGRMIMGLLTGDSEELLFGWRQFTSALSEGWEWMTGAMGKAWQNILIGLNRVFPGLGTMIEGWSKIVLGFWEGDTKKMGDGWKMLMYGWQKVEPRVTQALKDWMKGMGEWIAEEGFKAGQGLAAAIVRGAVQSHPLVMLFKGILGMGSTINDARRMNTPRSLPPSVNDMPWPEGIPRPEPPAAGALLPRALGGPVAAGQSYLVGERRPEVLEVPYAGTPRIWPSVGDWSRSRDLGAGALALEVPPLPALALDTTASLPAAEPIGGPSRGSVAVEVAPGAVVVNISGEAASDSEQIREVFDSAMEDFRIQLEATYRSLLND